MFISIIDLKWLYAFHNCLFIYSKPSIDFVDEYAKAATALKGLVTVAAIEGKAISQEMRNTYKVKVSF